MRVLVVDDSAFMRRAISTMLASDPQIEVLGAARNGKEGIEMAKRLKPDVITMDIEMPEMDGLTALRRIMHDCPTNVLMLSSLTTEGSHAALTALKLGAADFLAKDMSQVSLNITNIQEDLLHRVRALGRARKPVSSALRPATDTGQTSPVFRPDQFDVVCIGSSTGGPPLLEKILTGLPPTLSAPIVIAQHMPMIFTASMSERLGKECLLPVVHAEDRMPLDQRTIYIAPGGKNLHIKRLGLTRYILLVNDDPPEAIYKPSVDALLESAAASHGQRTLAVILTGIGEDGLVGARKLHAKGGTILAQNEETCVVYGMPKAVTQAALVAASLSPDQIGAALKTLAPKPAPSRATGTATASVPRRAAS